MRVLIIKTGHTETFDKSHASLSIVSLGDVLRTTVILHLFKNDQVTWLTSPEALPLLENNSYIQNLTVTHDQLTHSKWDLVVNLEKSVEALELLTTIHFQKLVGFDQNSKLNHDTLMVNTNWSQKLYHLFEKDWNREKYVFFPKEKIDPKYELGLNWKVGPKWQSKSWPFTNWENIYERVKDHHQTSWQQGFDNLNDYIRWIQSCKYLLTHDSLGLHLGLALGKPMVALFGPTLSTEIPFENTVVLSQSEIPEFSCPPCYQQLCHNKIHCVGNLPVELIESHLKNLLQGTDEHSTA